MKRKGNLTIVKRFFPYLLKYPLNLMGALGCGIIGGATTVVMTYYIGKAVDTLVGANQVNSRQLGIILLLLGGILLVSVFTQWIVQILGNQVAYQAVGALRKDTFLHLNQLPLRYYDQKSHGDIISRFTNDLDFVSEATAAIFNNVFSGMTIVVIALVSMLRLNLWLTVIVLVMTPLIFLVTWLVARSSQEHFQVQQRIVGDISGFVSEIVGNQKLVKAFQYENHAEERFDQLNQKLYVRGQKAQFASSLTNPLSRFIDHLAYIAIGLIGGFLALQAGSQVTVGMISSFTLYAGQFSKPFIELSGITTQIQTALAGLERTFTILDEPVETPDDQAAVALSKAKGEVIFQDVAFSYEAARPLLQDLNLHVQPGETVAIVGKTGAGKSTLVNLLMRFYEVDHGKILIDGLPLTAYTRDSLRRNFGMVLQDTWLFDGTIRENLAYGKPDATDQEIEDAARAALIDSFIQRLPKGYDTVIGSKGVSISAGQRQLLTIARTMVSDPPMLILDEATSSVDTLTEQKIQAAFLRMMQGKTSFVIAHRLGTIREADVILVMDQGKIVEIGDHESLLHKTDGYYQQLYAAQFAGNEKKED